MKGPVLTPELRAALRGGILNLTDDAKPVFDLMKGCYDAGKAGRPLEDVLDAPERLLALLRLCWEQGNEDVSH